MNNLKLGLSENFPTNINAITITHKIVDDMHIESLINEVGTLNKNKKIGEKTPHWQTTAKTLVAAAILEFPMA